MGLDSVFDARRWALMPFHFWSAVFFVLGCIVGSFLNVVIHRLPLGQSVVSPPSHCPHCKYAIPWYLNIPLVTWLVLRGRCRNCGATISFRYFAVELVTALVFLGTWLRFGYESPALAGVLAVFLAGLLAGAAIDHEHMIVPDEITYGGIGAGLLASLLVPALQGTSSAVTALKLSVLGTAVGAAVVYGTLRGGKLLFGRQKLKLAPETKIIFTETALALPDGGIPYEDLFYRETDAVIVTARRIEMIDRCYTDAVIHLTPGSLRIGEDTFSPEAVPCLEALADKVTLPREAMGLGDVKFMAAIGAFLGWKATVFSLFGSAVIGSVVAGTLFLVRWGRGSRQVAFVPYIALAAAFWVFKGDAFLEWLLNRR